MTDGRNGSTIFQYNAFCDLIESVTTPAPGVGQSPQSSYTYYNLMQQATNVVNPGNTSVTTEYFLTGELKKTHGSRTYPVEYTYDYAGRMQSMKTWTNYPSGNPAVTTWNYDLERGWLTNKAYANNLGPIYTYTRAGRLASRTWARGIETTYSNDASGLVLEINYTDGTPGVTNTYDRLGRLSQIAGASCAESLTYNDANQLLSESFTAGPLSGMAVTNAYDAYLRRTAVALDSQTSTLVNYGYDLASRLCGVTNGTSTAAYSYVANSPLVGQIDFNNGGSVHMSTVKEYDYLNRLTSISSVTTNGTALPITFTYSYNDANQRTRRADVDGSYWIYNYDTLGQVTSGKKYWADGTPVAGQQFEYAFDDIGNRQSTRAGGDENGANLRSASYTANNLNQYTSRGVPGYVDVLGLALATNTVTVNGTTAYRKGEYFRNERAVNNSSTALWTNIIVAAAGETSVTGNVFVAQSPEAFGYDLDGNLTNDGRWVFTWDAENRLTQIESLTNGPTASKRRVTWQYDSQGRRQRQTTYDLSSGSAVVTEDLKFVNDGWRCLAELNATNNALVRRYTWGLDLSGSMDGAGGVGGLLWMKADSDPQFCAYDGNGNVAGLVRGSTGDQTAAYEYDPFGRTIRMTGVFAQSNPFRFSTKRANDTTDLVLYEYRAYNPSTGRWLSRDPLQERGGTGLYLWSGNAGINYIDIFGLVWKIQRSGAARALAKADCGDTIQELAKLIAFDDKDFTKWLKPLRNSTMPSLATEPLKGFEFTIPNEIYIEFGEMFQWIDFAGPIPLWRDELQKTADLARNKGFHVLMTNPSNPDLARQHLQSEDIYAFGFAGHGGGSSTLTFSDGEGTTSLSSSRITRFGIAFFGAYGCDTATKDPLPDAKAAKTGYVYSEWEKNVSTRGIFEGVWGVVNGFQAWSHLVHTPGTNTR